MRYLPDGDHVAARDLLGDVAPRVGVEPHEFESCLFEPFGVASDLPPAALESSYGEICKRLREAGKFSPVLFLTAKDTTADRIRGFVIGGDDYLTKPFSVDELVLRVGAILRRTAGDAPTEELRVGDLTLEPAGQEVRRAGKLIALSPTEFRLLHYLMINAGTVVSKSQILNNVWDYDYEGSENVVELYIGYLRCKVDDSDSPLIHTRRGVGYVLREG